MVLSNTQERNNTKFTPIISGNRGGRNLFSEIYITIIPNLTKAFMKREVMSPISLMNKDAKIFNKILACHIQKYIF